MLYAVCTSVGGRRREEDIFFSFKSITHGYKGEVERGERTKAGRREGRSGRKGVGGKGDHNSAKCLGFYPFQSCWLAMYLVNIVHTLIYTIPTHALMCSDVHTHITHLL